MEFSGRLIQLLSERDLTQRQLADAIGARLVCVCILRMAHVWHKQS